MFLIQIDEMKFVDAEKIECIYVNKVDKRLCIITAGSRTGEFYAVDDKFVDLALSRISDLSPDIGSLSIKIQSALKKMGK